MNARLLAIVGLLVCAAAPSRAALLIESTRGPITPREIAAFKAFMQTQTPPPTPWQGPGHNAWSFGPGGRNLEAMGLMVEATGDAAILDLMIRWADECVAQRNDLLPAERGGRRVMWTGRIDKVWCPEAPTHKNALYAGCETEDAIALLSFARSSSSSARRFGKPRCPMPTRTATAPPILNARRASSRNATRRTTTTS